MIKKVLLLFVILLTLSLLSACLKPIEDFVPDLNDSDLVTPDILVGVYLEFSNFPDEPMVFPAYNEPYAPTLLLSTIDQLTPHFELFVESPIFAEKMTATYEYSNPNFLFHEDIEAFIYLGPDFIDYILYPTLIFLKADGTLDFVHEIGTKLIFDLSKTSVEYTQSFKINEDLIWSIRFTLHAQMVKETRRVELRAFDQNNQIIDFQYVDTLDTALTYTAPSGTSYVMIDEFYLDGTTKRELVGQHTINNYYRTHFLSDVGYITKMQWITILIPNQEV